MTESLANADPTVAIVVGGRFVAFDIARALQRQGKLAGIVSSYPRAFREGIPASRLRWNPVLGARESLALRLGRRPRHEVEYEHVVRFGRWAANHLPSADVLQAWTGYALESLVHARDVGSLAVAFRASAHIVRQAALLREEFERFGFAGEAVYEPMVERELKEYATADYIQVISSFARRTFIEQGIAAEKLLLTPLAVEIGEVSGIPRRPRVGPLRVLYLGSISLRKGVHYLLDAAHSLPRGAVQVSLIGGTSPDGEMILRGFARSGEWKGKVGRREIALVFAQHDVLVLPSIEDGFGAVICEAMAAGIPVIATTNTGGPDIIEHGVTGFLVPPRSVAAIAAALSRLVDDRAECEAMGRAAASMMRERRTWDDFSDEMLRSYRSLPARRPVSC